MIYNPSLNFKCNKAMRNFFFFKFQNCHILFEMFWKTNFKPLEFETLYLFHFKFVLSDLKVMGVQIRNLQDFFEIQMQLNNKKII